ncbi:unnamed protein product, partial [Didymodactylos carnosus]
SEKPFDSQGFRHNGRRTYRGRDGDSRRCRGHSRGCGADFRGRRDNSRGRRDHSRGPAGDYPGQGQRENYSQPNDAQNSRHDRWQKIMKL